MMTNETSRTVRWLVITTLTAATAGMIGVSLRANYLFGYGFGETAERAQVFGWANVGADLWKVTGLIVVGALWRARRRLLAVGLTPIWLCCLLWGLVGAVGIYAQDRTALIGGREAKAATYKDRERELEEVEIKLRTIGPQRTVAQVDAAIEAIFARPVLSKERVRGTVGKLSANCTKSERITAEACAEIAEVREERAAAAEAAALESRRSTLRARIAKLREGGGSLAADPVGELFAWLSRGQLSVRDIAFGFPLAFAFLIELVSAFGPVGIVAYAEATRREKGVEVVQVVAMSEPLQATLGETRRDVIEDATGRVVEWIADRCRPTSDPTGVEVEALHDDYDAWCVGKGLRALSREAFMRELDVAREMPQLAGETRKVGSRYYGIELAYTKIRKLVSRRPRP